jgi:toxin-antitoxin system PIN domain toxin
VKLVDANVLLYAVNEDAPHHAAAHSWLDAALGDREAIAFAWVVLLAFLRLGTRPGLFPHPLSLADATGVVELWLDQPAAVVVHPSKRHLGLLRGLLGTSGTAANLVTDAHLAALALEHGAEVVSFDRDFQRFEGLRLVVPGP